MFYCACAKKSRVYNYCKPIRNRLNVFELPDELFHTYYRLPRHAVMQLCDDLRPLLTIRRPPFEHSLTVEEKVLCTLRFLSTGNIFNIASMIVIVHILLSYFVI